MVMKSALAFTFSLIFILAHVIVQGQAREQNAHQSKQITRILQQIGKEPIYIIDNEEKSDQEKNYRLFARSSSPYEFLKLAMEDKNPMVRIYAFRAAAERMDELPAELVLKFKNDKTPVKVRVMNQEKELPLHEIINGFLK